MMVGRILVTGASGFVGRYLVAALKARHPAATLITAVAGAAPVEAADAGSVDIVDRAAVDSWVRDAAPDMVVHLAAQSSVARAALDADLTWATNLTGTLNIATAVARHVPDATVLFASTAEVYGSSYFDSPVSEATPLRPLNPYAKSKALAEQVLADVLPRSARLIVARPGNHTGPGQAEQFVLASFAAQIARMEARQQEPVLRVGNLDVRRDFLDVQDIIDGYVALIEKAPSLPNRLIVNLSTGSARLLRTLAETMQALALIPFEIRVDPARLRASDFPVAYATADLMRALTGWRPSRDVEATLAALLDHARGRVEAARRG